IGIGNSGVGGNALKVDHILVQEIDVVLDEAMRGVVHQVSEPLSCNRRGLCSNRDVGIAQQPNRTTLGDGTTEPRFPWCNVYEPRIGSIVMSMVLVKHSNQDIHVE